MSNPLNIPAATEGQIKAFLLDWRQNCNAAQLAVMNLMDAKSNLDDIRNSKHFKDLPKELSSLLDEVEDFDLDDLECRLLEVEPDFENLGQLGKRIVEEGFCELAMAKWHKSGGGQSDAHSAVYHADGNRFVEIWDADGAGTLAVYRVTRLGKLRRLQEWTSPGGGVPQFSRPARDHS